MQPKEISNPNSGSPSLFVSLSLIFAVIWSLFLFQAVDYTDWWLENILVFAAFAWLLVPSNRNLFSKTGLVLIFLFLMLHIYGAKMAYTMNEAGEFFQEKFDLARNPYDRFVHFSFGLLLLLPVFEFISARTTASNKLKLIIANMAILCAAAIFELLEWAVAMTFDSATGETYVATQGDPWDAQKDIVLAALGAIIVSCIIFFNRTLSKRPL